MAEQRISIPRPFRPHWRCRVVALALLCLAPHAWPQPLADDHPRLHTARRVFNDLVTAIGDGRLPPQLQLVPYAEDSNHQIAWYQAERHVLTIDTRAYELCAGFGADSLAALAALLGHELAHFYKDHRLAHTLASGFATRANRSLTLDQMAQIEAEADHFGGFYGTLAGYRPLDITPRLLTNLYAAYNLEQNLAGYPPLDQRLEIAARSLEQLEEWLLVFEAGHRLLLAGEYALAGRGFDFIARHFPSRELLNNAGTAYALEALTLFTPAELRFAYPFEPDPESRLNRTQVPDLGYAANLEQRRLDLLQNAHRLFTQATQRDPNYAPGFVNLACTAALLGQTDEADFYGLKAARLAGQQNEAVTLAQAHIFRGIILATAAPADTAGARAAFTAALNGHQALAQLNLERLQGTAPLERLPEKRYPRRETIDALKPDDHARLLDTYDAAADLPRLDWQHPLVNIYSKRTTTSRAWFIDARHSKIGLLETLPSYTGATARSIRIGQSAAAVVQAYGHPARSVGGPKGSYLVYAQSKIIFHLDESGTVVGWMLYTRESH